MTGPAVQEKTAMSAEDRARSRRQRRAAAYAEAASAGWKVRLVKIVALAVIDALALYAVFALAASAQWTPAVLVAVGVLAINAVYLIPGLLPAKYLTPGLVFLLIFQIFVVLYSGYVAFTNYGSG